MQTDAQNFFPTLIDTPAVLYHYTSMDGLLGIVHNKKIWATDTRFLNDKSEMDLLWHLVKQRIEQRLEGGETAHPDFLERLQGVIAEREDSEVFVSCFSKLPDSLSQWRAYCSGTSGFSIGFDSSALMNIKTGEAAELQAPTVARLAKVRYESGESGESIDRVIEFARTFVDRNEYLFSAVKDFDFARVPLKMLAPQFKHPAFEEEQEWRVIQPTHKFLECRKKFRAGKSMLVPYIELALAEDPYFIKEVFVGPSPNTSLSVASVKGLFESHGHSDVEVRESQIPYRYW